MSDFPSISIFHSAFLLCASAALCCKCVALCCECMARGQWLGIDFARVDLRSWGHATSFNGYHSLDCLLSVLEEFCNVLPCPLRHGRSHSTPGHTSYEKFVPGTLYWAVLLAVGSYRKCSSCLSVARQRGWKRTLPFSPRIEACGWDTTTLAQAFQTSAVVLVVSFVQR